VFTDSKNYYFNFQGQISFKIWTIRDIYQVDLSETYIKYLRSLENAGSLMYHDNRKIFNFVSTNFVHNLMWHNPLIMSVSQIELAEYSVEIKKGVHKIKHIILTMLAVTLSLSVGCNKIS
jgi:hypothetical protein